MQDYVDLQLTCGIVDKHPFRGARNRRGYKPDFESEKATANLETMRRLLETDRISAPKLSVMEECSKEDGESKPSSKAANAGSAARLNADQSPLVRPTLKGAKVQKSRYGARKRSKSNRSGHSSATNDPGAGSQVCFSTANREESQKKHALSQEDEQAGSPRPLT